MNRIQHSKTHPTFNLTSTINNTLNAYIYIYIYIYIYKNRYILFIHYIYIYIYVCIIVRETREVSNGLECRSPLIVGVLLLGRLFVQLSILPCFAAIDRDVNTNNLATTTAPCVPALGRLTETDFRGQRKETYPFSTRS
jgi:hypothetical protein